MYTLYSLLYLAALSLLFPFEYLKRPKSLRKKWLREKLGFIKADTSPVEANTPAFKADGKSQTVWLHAVSVGEVNASVPFLRAMTARYPSLGIVVSTITDTGQKVASERLSDIAKIIYLPFDAGFSLKRAIRRIRPVIFISFETEIWPNTFRLMREAGAPVAILNGRISEKSYSGYKKISFFLKRVFDNVSLFCMQDELYAERAVGLGASKEKVQVTGNFKFDINALGGKPEWADTISGPVIIAGSTHRGEEELILGVYLRLKEEFPTLNLILAPRHPARFREVEELIASKRIHPLSKGIQVVKRSGMSENQSNKAAGGSLKGSVLLLDVMGELFSAYSISDIAIIGGSFIEHGGQNPLEPAYWGKPILCGPHMENFPFVEEFFREGGALSITKDKLYQVLGELLKNPDRRHSIGKKAKELCGKNAGAVEKTINALSAYLKIR